MTGAGLACWARTGWGRLGPLARWGWPVAAAVLGLLALTTSQRYPAPYADGWAVVTVAVAVVLTTEAHPGSWCEQILSWRLLC